jgi:predicted TIM-barrel fold metal-dependent hydrolase
MPHLSNLCSKIFSRPSDDRIPSQLQQKEITELERRICKMEEDEVSFEAISLSPKILPKPGMSKRGALFSKAVRAVNRFLGNIVEKYGHRFAGVALIPVNSGCDEEEYNIEELEKCVGEDKLSGVIPVSGLSHTYSYPKTPIALYKRMNELRIPLVIREVHSKELSIQQTRLRQSEEFSSSRIFGRCLSLINLVQNEITNTFPSLPIVFSPCREDYLCPLRWKTFQGQERESFPGNRVVSYDGEKFNSEEGVVPSGNENFKEIYLDTACSSAVEIQFFNRFIGSERMVFGTEAPYEDRKTQISNVKSGMIREDEEERVKILRLNAARLLKLRFSQT